MGYKRLTAALYAYLIALIDVESKTCKKSYYDRHPGIQLQNHVIKKITTSNIFDCVTECVNTPGCLSMNSKSDGNAVHCELNKSNQHGSPANLIKTSFDRVYLEMVSNHWPNACFNKDGWYRGQSAAYKFVNEPATVQEARQRCLNMSAGADLVSFADKQEEQIFEEYLTGFGQLDRIWIGLNDIAKEGTFVWYDGTKSGHTNWRSGEPNNHKDNEDCTLKDHRQIQGANIGKWNDGKCTSKFEFACKVYCS